MTFEHLPIQKDILRALKDAGYETPTPIQEQSIPVLLEGKDVLGSAQTGTGKTAAFAIPILQGLSHMARSKTIKALILAPTRELAAQINDSFKAYGKHVRLTSAVIFGGVAQGPQTQAVRRGVDILVATPGRLLDLIGQGIVDLSSISYLVLDEADRMLDMGFIHDVKKIITHIPDKRQTMLFSATLPHEILELSRLLLKDPVRISVVPVEATLDIITQKLYKVKKADKTMLLAYLLSQPDVTSALVFTRTKHFANKLMKSLTHLGFSVDAIHGNKSQSARTLALSNFKKSRTDVLVATDIAARGLDIEGLSHVVNFDLPEVPETYIHRIGRTGRAGFSGTSISFQTPEEEKYLRDIERHIKMRIPLQSFDIKAATEVVEKRKKSVPETPPQSEPRPKIKKFKEKKAKIPAKRVDIMNKAQAPRPEKAFEKKAEESIYNRDKKPDKSNKQSVDNRQKSASRPSDKKSFKASSDHRQRPQRNDRHQGQEQKAKRVEQKEPLPPPDNIIDGKVVYRYNRNDYHYNRDALVKSDNKDSK